MSRADEVRELLARPGATQASVAAELGVSQQRVSALARGCTTSRRAQPVVQPLAGPDARPGSAGVVQPTDPAALREQVRAQAARIAELEGAAVPASCPGCARLEQDYEALEAGRDDLARRLSAWEDPC